MAMVKNSDLLVEDLSSEFEINLTLCVGMGTDLVMASQTKGAVFELCKKATQAKRCPCNNLATKCLTRKWKERH